MAFTLYSDFVQSELRPKTTRLFSWLMPSPNWKRTYCNALAEGRILDTNLALVFFLEQEWLLQSEASIVVLSDSSELSGLPDRYYWPEGVPKSVLLNLKGLRIGKVRVPSVFISATDATTPHKTQKAINSQWARIGVNHPPPQAKDGNTAITLSFCYPNTEGNPSFLIANFTSAEVDRLLRSKNGVQFYGKIKNAVGLNNKDKEAIFEACRISIAALHHIAVEGKKAAPRNARYNNKKRKFLVFDL